MPDSSRVPRDASSGRGPLTPLHFIVLLGVVSALMDVVYEGARSVTGPFLAVLGGSALLISVVTGAGEAVALVLRLVFGRLADRPRLRWRLTLAGYGLTALSVPLLGVTNALWIASVLVLTERLGKAVRSPAKDSMLANAGAEYGRGKAFAVHEALDQSGAFVGPLVVAAVISASGSYSPAFLATRRARCAPLWRTSLRARAVAAPMGSSRRATGWRGWPAAC